MSTKQAIDPPNITADAIAKCREEHRSLQRQAGDRVPVIVASKYDDGPHVLGVQYWTAEMILAGISANTDHTQSAFVDYLFN